MKEVVCIELIREASGFSTRFRALDHLILLKDVFVVRLSLLQDLYCGVPDLNQLVLLGTP